VKRNGEKNEGESLRAEPVVTAFILEILAILTVEGLRDSVKRHPPVRIYSKLVVLQIP